MALDCHLFDVTMLGQRGDKIIGGLSIFLWNKDRIFVSNFIAHKRGHCGSCETTRLQGCDGALKLEVVLCVFLPQVVHFQLQVAILIDEQALVKTMTNS